MLKSSAAEIKVRFATVHKKHLERWDKENPVPAPPTPDAVVKEINVGRVTVDKKQLGYALKPDSDYDRTSFTEVVSTPSMEKWFAAKKDRENARKGFEEKLQEAKDAYLDRVLFDHESGFLLLRDFQRWHETKASGTTEG